MRKKLILIISAVVLFLAVAASIFFATVGIGSSYKNPDDFEAKAVSYIGSCGDNITWKLNTVTGKLELEGKGKFKNIDSPESIPWRIYSKYIKEVTVQNGITDIAPYLFYRTKRLVSVEIPRSVKTIGANAFYGCGDLLSVKFAENSNLEKIDEAAFAYCRSLKNIDIPSRVTSIGKNAFLCCYSIPKLTLGYSVSSVGQGAFSSCSGLKKLRIVNYNCDIYDDGETFYSGITLECFKKSSAKEYAEKYLREYSLIKDMNNINEMKVKLSFTECVYNGKKQKPKVTIKGLDIGKDYTVNYVENVQPGIGSVIVSAAGSTLGEVTLKFKIKPQKAKSLRVRTADETKLTLTWNKVHGASGYEVYQYLSGEWKKIKTVKSNSVTVKELTCATKYQFKVRAYVKVDNGKIYGKFGKVCECATCPEAVNLKSVVNRGVGRLTISWNRVKKADGYIVYTSTKKVGGYKEAATLNGSGRTLCVLNNLKSNQKLYVTVKAFVKVGDSKVIGKDGDIIAKPPM